MVDLDEARAIALNVYGGYDSFEETEHAFLFGDSSHDDDEGGMCSPVVVMKEDGAIRNFVYALQNDLLGKRIRMGELS